jgi:hypothetical protein
VQEILVDEAVVADPAVAVPGCCAVVCDDVAVSVVSADGRTRFVMSGPNAKGESSQLAIKDKRKI